MLIRFPEDIRIFIACGYTDMRRQIDGLSAIVQMNFQLDPFQNSLFLFCGKKRDRMKALFWEGDGFLLLYKRLESVCSSGQNQQKTSGRLLHNSIDGYWKASQLIKRKSSKM